MTAALLLAADLKDDGAITIRIDGDGPLGKVVADAIPSGYVRGYVANPQADLPLNNGKINVGGGVGQGLIHVTRFTNQNLVDTKEDTNETARFTRLNQPFTGSVPLVSGEIGEDVANYLLVSEQTPSTVALGVLVNPDLTVAAAGGFIVQAMPGAEDAVLAQVEQNLAAMPPVSQMVKQGEDAAAILSRIFAGMPSSVLESSEVAFYCHCSDERIENMLVSLGRKELAEMVLEGQAEVRCHFCGELYQIGRERLKQLHDSTGA